jgi:hypothetical protein
MLSRRCSVGDYRDPKTWWSCGSTEPTIGEVYDRLSILELKILYAKVQGAEVTRFEMERQKLSELLDSKVVLTSAYLEIAAVNAAIWHMTGTLRELERRDAQGEHEIREYFGKLALQVFRWNERRAAIITRVNEDWGMTVKEKV